MSAGAAFFDLDRTLLKGPSGPAINESVAEAGLTGGRRLPGEALLFGIYNLMGETLPSMALTRSAALMARGWPADVVRQAGKAAAERLEPLVSPYARLLLADHRRAGHPLVMATTTPYDLVAPLAERLGFDDIVATRYAEQDGVYTGRLVDGFVWSRGKLTAVRRWARHAGVSLEESFAYSDSVYDLPLLSAVGHPHAVNPDLRLLPLALLQRWPVLHLDVPPGVPKIMGMEPLDLMRLVVHPQLLPFVRLDIGDVSHIPDHGPAVLVANHRSYFDVVALGLTVLKSGRPLRYLGKKEVFDAPVIGPMAKAMGGIRVERGSGSDQPLLEAARALEAGELVAIQPQGTIPRGRDFFHPVLKGRTGAARLAAMTGAPVIPIGLWGTEAVWPRSSRIPNLTNVLHPPAVRTRVGRPVRLELVDAEADTERIMAAIVDLLPPEARLPREPTTEEIARALPAGHQKETAAPGREPNARAGTGRRGGTAPAKAARNRATKRAPTIT
ncbi:MAG TPA: HAD-IB family hydrolase [Acidimicrobiales bacterium]|nr:HAD-IB family hydrolase [Acidimicrobiales bacterium]